MPDPDAALGSAAIIARAGTLTRRERQVLGLLGVGYSRAQVAAKLDSSLATVRNQITNAVAKLGARNGAHAACLLLRAEHYAARAEAGEHAGEGYRAALGAIRGLLTTQGAMQGQLATLAAAVERLAQDAAKRPHHAP